MDQRTRGPEPIRVILADDHTLVREGTRRILEATNTVSVVAEAADGGQAVEVVDRFEPDVAIIDIGMPGINGIEATRRIKRAHPRVGVLVLSMHDDDQFIFAVLEAGAAGYLLKDVEGHQLVNAEEAVHAGESVLHPAVARKVLARLASDLQENSQPETEEPKGEDEQHDAAHQPQSNEWRPAPEDIAVRPRLLRAPAPDRRGQLRRIAPPVTLGP